MKDSTAAPTPESPATPLETITLEITASNLPEQSRRDLKAHSILRRIPESELLAELIGKKLGGIFTVRAA